MESTGYKIVALQHLDEFIEKDLLFADEVPYDISSADFINLIRYAEYICTDSFHGTCFSIINYKKFLTFNRFKPQNIQSTNTRIDSLLKMAGLEERQVSDMSNTDKLIEKINKDIDYINVDKRLDIKKRESFSYLSDALEE